MMGTSHTSKIDGRGNKEEHEERLWGMLYGHRIAIIRRVREDDDGDRDYVPTVRANCLRGQNGDHVPEYLKKGGASGRSPSMHPARLTNKRSSCVLGRGY